MPITSPNVKLSSPGATALPGPRPYNRLTAADIPAPRRQGPSCPPSTWAMVRATVRATVRSVVLAGAALGAVAAAAGVTAWPRPAQAFCGFFVSGADAQLYNNASQVALLRNS